MAASAFAFLLSIASGILLSPLQAYAQAGSRPPQYFDTPQTFYHSLNGSAPSQAGIAPSQPLAPNGVWQLGADTHYLLWVELSQGRLNVLENLGDAGIVLRKRIPVSIGKQGIGKQLEGDNKTPIGIYRIESFLNDDSLDDFYGAGAYPLNYPNPLDLIGAHTGHGIWLHGLPKREAQRPFLTSEGCIVIDNQSLTALAKQIGPGSTMILSQQELQWLPLAQQQAQTADLKQAMTGWRKAWEARDTGQYLSFYARDFTDLHRDKHEWSTYKSRVNADKKYIRVDVSDVSMLEEPARPELVNVVFMQRYVSDNHRWQGRKQQLWRHDGDGWKIIFEGDYF